MEGYINITENSNHEFSVTVNLVNGNLWLSTWQMATLFNVYTKNIENSLKAIFKVGLLKENEVSKMNIFVNNGRQSEQRLYNLKTLIFVGFRITSFEAKAFQEWILRTFSKSVDKDYHNPKNIWIDPNHHGNVPITICLN